MFMKVEYKTYRGQDAADVTQICPMCNKRSHVVFTGSKKVDLVSRFVSDGHMMQQELPFDAPVREFMRTGYCQKCMEMMFGTTSTEIKYVKGKE